MKTKNIFTATVCIIACCLLPTAYSFSQGTWSQKANFGGTGRYIAVGFSIGTKGYIGTGYDGAYKNDFWEWDQANNIWSQKANFVGTARDNATGFSIGTKGYIGIGFDGANKNDFWEWDPSINIWTQKANFGGTARREAVGFSIGTKGYIGTGYDGVMKQDFWEFDPSTNVWTQKANFGGTARYEAIGFSIGAKGYIGTGSDGSTLKQDFWEWDQATNVWTQKANFTGTVRRLATGFSIGTKGYIGIGSDISNTPYQDFWEWDQGTNVWTQKANFGGTARYAAVGFSIGTKGYIGTGVTYKQDFWEFAPLCNLTVTVNATPASCANSSGTANAIVSGGNSPYTYLWNTGDVVPTIAALAAGTYRVNVTDAAGCFSFADGLVTNSNGPAISVTGLQNISCNGLSDGAINITVTGGNPPYNYKWSNGAATQNISALAFGPYDITVSDASNCIAQQSILITQPAPLSIKDSVINSSCAQFNGEGYALVSGGTQPYSYTWSNASVTPFITGVNADIYQVVVTDANNCKKSKWVDVADSTGPLAFLDSIESVACGDSGAAWVTAQNPANVWGYWWTNGTTQKDLTGVPAGVYGCKVQDFSGCKYTWNVKIPPVLPPLKPICLVTVDTSSKMNIVVWEKPTNALFIHRFNVYRESSAPGVYQLIDSVLWTSLSVYFDSVPDPNNRWAKYRVSMVDDCGKEGPMSPENKTIHLALQPTSNNLHHDLIWDAYDGFAFSYYHIYRKANTNGAWKLIDSVLANVTAYSDTAFNSLDTNYYHVDVDAPQGGCTPSIKNPTTFATNLNTSRSNIYKVTDSTTVGMNEANLGKFISVYPNPSTGEFTVSSLQFPVKDIEVYDIYGKKVYQTTVNRKQETLNLSAAGSGIYFLQLKTERGTVTKKLVLSR
ncbi:MAG: T9SS type A sorting domain-containing protein [Bacteroidetes bacterium]|nr:T9SS type A sorting domain-containing protein [Bacteroidota bacterium]